MKVQFNLYRLDLGEVPLVAVSSQNVWVLNLLDESNPSQGLGVVRPLIWNSRTCIPLFEVVGYSKLRSSNLDERNLWFGDTIHTLIRQMMSWVGTDKHQVSVAIREFNQIADMFFAHIGIIYGDVYRHLPSNLEWPELKREVCFEPNPAQSTIFPPQYPDLSKFEPMPVTLEF